MRCASAGAMARLHGPYLWVSRPQGRRSSSGREGRRLLYLFLWLLAGHQVAWHASMLDHEAMRIGTKFDQVRLLTVTRQQLSALLFGFSARRGVNGLQVMILAVAKCVFHHPEDLLRR